MKEINEFLNKHGYLVIFGSAILGAPATLSSITGNNADLSGSYDWVAGHPVFVFWLTFFLGFLAYLFICFFLFTLIKMNNDKKKKKKKRDLTTLAQRKCRVLIVDDNDTDLKEIETKLRSGINQRKMHGVYINSIPDYRLAADFDIIISDIYGAGSGSEESIGALKALWDTYPYKIVAAMSSITNKETKNKLGDQSLRFLSKRKKNEIKDFVETSIERLDNLEAFILSVEASLMEKGLNDEEIKTKREGFLDYLERMKHLAGN